MTDIYKKPCSKNPELMDLYIKGSDDWDMMIFCADNGKWENERRIKKRLAKAGKR